MMPWSKSRRRKKQKRKKSCHQDDGEMREDAEEDSLCFKPRTTHDTDRRE